MATAKGNTPAPASLTLDDDMFAELHGKRGRKEQPSAFAKVVAEAIADRNNKEDRLRYKVVRIADIGGEWNSAARISAQLRNGAKQAGLDPKECSILNREEKKTDAFPNGFVVIVVDRNEKVVEKAE